MYELIKGDKFLLAVSGIVTGFWDFVIIIQGRNGCCVDRAVYVVYRAGVKIGERIRVHSRTIIEYKIFLGNYKNKR
jgi:hypothetical protein